MRARVQKWGNSLALRIPRAYALDTHLEAGTLVELSSQEDALVIRPLIRPKYVLDELLADLDKASLHPETDTGAPSGSEAW